MRLGIKGRHPVNRVQFLSINLCFRVTFWTSDILEWTVTVTIMVMKCAWVQSLLIFDLSSIGRCSHADNF